MDYKFDDKKKVLLLKGNGNVNSILKILKTCDDSSSWKTLKSSKKKLPYGSKSSSSSSAQLADLLVVVCGGCRLGSQKEDELDKAIKELEKYGGEHRCHFVFVRGHHDNPVLFDGEKIASDHVVAVPNYSVLSACEKKFLCVGGAVSYDRSWPYGVSYKGEAPEYKPELVNCDINGIITEAAPTFMAPVIDFTSKWFECDESLKQDIINERHVMDQIYMHFTDGKSRVWYYTKYNQETVTSSSFFTFMSIVDQRAYTLATQSQTENKESLSFEMRSFSEIFENRGGNPIGVNHIQAPEPYIIHGLQAAAPRQQEPRPIWVWDADDVDDLFDMEAAAEEVEAQPDGQGGY